MSSGFITEAEIAEKRKCRQEEWEKVRRPDQPLEAPEEEYDHRSLFDRLQEQKQKRDFEYEEAHRLKNMIKGLDDDEVEFLDLVDRSKLAEERKQRGEEARELASYRSAVATLQQHSRDQRIRHEMIAKPAQVTGNSSYTSQTKLLAGAVVKKRPVAASADQKQTTSSSPPSSKTTMSSSPPPAKKARTEDNTGNDTGSPASQAVQPLPQATAAGLQCIGILPGISYSESSSDSASSSDDEAGHAAACADSGCHSSHQHHVDMIGRKLFFKQKVASESE